MDLWWLCRCWAYLDSLLVVLILLEELAQDELRYDGRHDGGGLSRLTRISNHGFSASIATLEEVSSRARRYIDQ
jgi:hypothetical protein